ncbi:MAG: HNH endonuclease [Mycobacterium sp.]|nr:HNH endonuclease [Mycobacterium sp.]
MRALLCLALISCLAAAGPRSAAVRAEFQRLNPCPANGATRGACPGWVVDHVVPRACGGADAPGNLQWQSVAAAREKDRWEREVCGMPGL